MKDAEDPTSTDSAETAEDDTDHVTDPTRADGVAGRIRPRQRPETKLERGALVGRYVVLGVLGKGGMGVVYAAYDPELDRKLALKLLQAQPSETSSHGQAWLVREAQALARLSHPNVVAVHDVGTLPGDRVFVAIEMVEGKTLREWMKTPRDWPIVRAVMLEAGAGLAAAHRAGLIHRDFKPDNVLVGDDGRARVMDFGLARLEESGPAARDSVPPGGELDVVDVRGPLGDSLTIAGSVVGTPAYMAPELFEGVPASARSDQFAFGVTLYELLFKIRPYDKKAFVAPRMPNLAPRDPPKSSSVPARLRRIAMRAIAIDPEARFGSLDDLLAELSIDPMARRRRAAIVAAGAISLAGVIGVTVALSSGSSTPDADRSQLCKGAERHLAGVWDPTIKRAVKTAFDATDRSFKTKAYTTIATTLDRYASEWTAAVTDSCEATRLRGEQTDDVLSLRQDCFDQHLAVLESFAALMASADGAAVDKASNAALAFERSERIADCGNVAALKEPTRPTPELRSRLAETEHALAEARAAILAGNHGRTLNAGAEAARRAKQIPFDPAIAEAETLRGMALIQLGNGPDALASLGEAAWAGIRGKRDDLAAEAALYAALGTSELLNRNAEARIWLGFGKAAASRAHNNPILRLRSLEIEGIVLSSGGEPIPAVAAHEQALVLARQVFGESSMQLARSEQVLGATLTRLGDYQRARPHYERGLELSIQLLGPDHPDVALMHSGFAVCLHYTGDLARSHTEFDRALAIRERVFGKTSPVLIATLNNMAELYRDENNTREGLPLIERALDIVLHSVGKGHPYFVTITSTYGELLLVAGRIAEARAKFDEAIAAAEAQKSPYLAAALTSRATASRAENKWAESAAFDERSIASYEATVGKDGADLWKPLSGLAIAKLELGKLDEARAAVERSLAIAHKAHVPDALLGEPIATRARLDKK